jgi:hypothetical protein
MRRGVDVAACIDSFFSSQEFSNGNGNTMPKKVGRQAMQTSALW